MPSNDILVIDRVSHQYPKGTVAVNDVSAEVARGKILGLLGPNGSGKTTLFRLVSGLLPLQQGRITLDDRPVDQCRDYLGIVFQSASLDKKLSVQENLWHQGHLYGLSGSALNSRIAEVSEAFHLRDKAKETIENLSGGWQRRVEIAKALLHRPSLLLLDEPSTGLDPGARREWWQTLRTLQAEQKVTILLTTHLMDEAEQCDRVLLLDHGRKVDCDTPAQLKAQVLGTVVSAVVENPKALVEAVRTRLGLTGRVLDREARWEWQPGAGGQTAGDWANRLLQEWGAEIEAVTLSAPTLEDVMIQKTGRGFDSTIETGGLDLSSRDRKGQR
jgi:ABC-2 type transport system ATP-binding protein